MYDIINVVENDDIDAYFLNHTQEQLDEFKTGMEERLKELRSSMSYLHYLNPESRVLGIPNSGNLPDIDQGVVAWPIDASSFQAKFNGIHRIELWSIEVNGISFFMEDITAEYTYDESNYCFRHGTQYEPRAYGNIFVYAIAYAQAHASQHAADGLDALSPANINMYTRQEVIDEWGDGTGDPWDTPRDAAWINSIAAGYKINKDYALGVRFLTSYGTQVAGELFVCNADPGV